MKRLVVPPHHAELVSASISPQQPMVSADRWTLKQVQGDVFIEPDGFSLELNV